MRARTRAAASPSCCAGSSHKRLADTAALPNAVRHGIYEPQELSGSKALAKLAKRAAQRSPSGEAPRAARPPRRRRSDPLRTLSPHDPNRPTPLIY